jgi:hypothetical protein
MRRGSSDRQQHMDLTPGGTPLGRTDPRFCLGVGRPTKMPPDNVESKRSEDGMRKTTLLLLLGHESE